MATQYRKVMPHYVSLTSAREILCNAERILVVGCSGGGKTTLALKIAAQFELEYQSIDRDVYWLPNWQVRGSQDRRNILKRLVVQKKWVMDGNNPSTFDLRVPRADLIIWVRIPRAMSLAGLARRVISNYGSVRPAMAEGCPEPFPDREFLSYIWNFERNTAPRFVEEIDRYGPEIPTVEIKTHRDCTQLTNSKRPLA